MIDSFDFTGRPSDGALTFSHETCRIARAAGAQLWDADGNCYLDFVGAGGAAILGYARQEVLEAIVDACARGLSFDAATEQETKLARLICDQIPSIEVLRMVDSGTEAVLCAIRAARGYTGREKILKFAGCYHGQSDALLVQADGEAMTGGSPVFAGIPVSCTKDTLIAGYNDLASVEALFARFPEEIACVVVEPVAANMGVVLPEHGFLEGLRYLCSKYGALLLFDETSTGFRLGFGGAQEYFGVRPDLTTFGNSIGAGMTAGAYGGKRAIMEQAAPVAFVSPAGVHSGNPAALSAGCAQLSILLAHPEAYRALNDRAELFFKKLELAAEASGVPCQVNHIGSLGCLYFTAEPVRDYARARTADTARYAEYWSYMLKRGVYLAPAQFGAMFLSMAHTQQQLDETVDLVTEYLLTTA